MVYTIKNLSIYTKGDKHFTASTPVTRRVDVRQVAGRKIVALG
jgi:hypothetical protein